MSKIHINVIGGGNMGLTYALALQENSAEFEVSITEKNPDTKARLESETSFKIYEEFEKASAAQKPDYILLAVKPQVAIDVFKQISSYLQPDQVVVSIMAGITLDQLSKGLPQITKLARAMPNLPSQIQKGVTGFVASKGLDSSEREKVITILSSTGIVIALDNEDQIDKITALSGSGPAYVFYFMEALSKKAESWGFNKDQAKEIAVNTFLGSVLQYSKSSLDLKTLIDQVSSKGGTTEAALRRFSSHNISHNIEEGIDKAYLRAKELGN